MPHNHAAVRIFESGGRRGRGVFALVDLPGKHNIIIEPPVLSCIHWRQRHGKRTVSQEWLKLAPYLKTGLQRDFRKLKDVPCGNHLERRHRRQLERFIDEYGFWEPQRINAHIYTLASHINHACVSCANAEQWTDSKAPHTITVKLVKPLKKGDEVFINYNRPGLSFRCAVCSPRGIKGCFRAVGDSLFR